jgi:hypothetical protein
MYAQYMQAPRKEIRVSKLVRQSHRWLSVIFTATVIANFRYALGHRPQMSALGQNMQNLTSLLPGHCADALARS